MSTIAYYNGIMAADTLSVNGNEKMTGMSKIGSTAKYLFGFAGRLSSMDPMWKWITEVENDCDTPMDFRYHGIAPPDLDNDFTVLLANQDGQLWEMFAEGAAVVMPRHYAAIGSGSDYALGALYFGERSGEANALAAVVTAIEFDPHTGGSVQEISFGHGLKRPNV